MQKKKYVIDLTAEERVTLTQLLQGGKAPARKLTRARILLKADDGLTDEEIGEAVEVSVATIERTRQWFVQENLAALDELPCPGGKRKLSGKDEARFVALVCTPAPEGYTRWTLQLLADKVVELGFAESIARETIRQTLKKSVSNRGNLSSGACPP